MYWVHFLRRLANEGMIIWVFSEISEGYIPTFAIVFNLSKLGPFSKTCIFLQLFSPQCFFHISASVEEEMKAHESVFGLRVCHGTDVIALSFWNQVQVPFSGVEWHSVALLVKPHLLKFQLFLLLLLQLLEPKIHFLRVRVHFLRVNCDKFSVLWDLSLCINDPFFVPKCTSDAICHH